MDGPLLIVIVVLFVIVAGVLAYVAQDYFKYKEAVSTDLNTVNDALTNESGERVSSVKKVVDQINTVNTDIYNTFSSNVASSKVTTDGLKSSVTSVMDNQNMLVGNINKYLIFSSNTSVLSAGNAREGQISIMNIPGSVTPDLRLITRVSAVGGMTINNLSSNIPMEMCSATNPSRCMRFPDKDGNTYLTSFASDKNIVMGANADFQGKVTFMSGNADGYTQYASIYGTGNDMTISSVGNVIFDTSKSIGIGTTLPSALLDVTPPTGNTRDIISGGPFKVDKGGNVSLTSVQFGQANTNNVSMTVDAKTGSLRIRAPGGVTLESPSWTRTWGGSNIK
jgi:hypothetical protein